MWIVVTIMLCLVISALLMMVVLFSNAYRAERIRFESRAARDVVDVIENIRTYGQEENGWRNNFPSAMGWERTKLHVAKDYILITGKSNFPFIFKTEIQPFIISIGDLERAMELGCDRVFKPYNVRVTNYGSDLELTIKPSAVLGAIKVHLTFENIGKRRLEKLFEITNWT